MKLLRKTFGITLISSFILLALLFVSPIMAEGKLESTNELPSIHSSNSQIATTQSALEETVKNDIVVLYKEEAQNNVKQLDLNKADFSAASTLNSQIDVLRPNNKKEADELIAKICQNENVLAVDYDSIAKAQDIPNDERFNKQKDYLNKIGYEKVWNLHSKNQVKVAVIDTGVKTDHKDLINRTENTGKNYVEGEDFTDYKGHGTRVTSALVAETNNSIGMAGTAGLSDVIAVPYKIGDKEGMSNNSLISSAIIDACNRDDIKILNISYGMKNTKVLSEAVQIAENKGKLVVAAAGNNNTAVNFPAGYPTVIGMGAVNEKNQRCADGDWSEGLGSCFGKELNLMAPGKWIVVADPSSGGYVYSGGTSLATPIVSATAAIMLGQNENLTPSEIRDILYSTALDLGDPGRDDYYGYGLVMMDKAVNKAQELQNYRGIIRLYNTVTGEHLYTADHNEAVTLSQQADWNNEGAKWESPLSGEPVYRLYSPITHNHLYTSDQNEVKTLLNSKAWNIDNDGKAVFYSGGSTGIYRLYNDELKMHLLTTDPVEYSTLPHHGWKQEGTTFLGLSIW